MSIHDIKYYTTTKKKMEEIEPILNALDNIVDILYNNMGNSGMFRLLEQAEELRVELYVRHYEYQQILKSKGKIYYDQD